MREIKFRGINTITGKWVYGGFVKINNLPYIVPFNSNTNISIRPETIGQSTGLKDKNGVEIHGGDMVKDEYIYGSVLYDGYMFVINIDNDNQDYLMYANELEVIGNIHEDNL